MRDTQYQPKLAIVMDYYIIQDFLDPSQIKEIIQKDWRKSYYGMQCIYNI